jgi:hypothetical protein
VIAGILLAIVGGLIANELCEFSPWCARKLVRWSAFRRYTDPGRAEMRAEELTAVIDDRPGNLFKLITAVSFAVGAVGKYRYRRSVLLRRLGTLAPCIEAVGFLNWESFERLVLAMARSLDGGYDVRRYGRLGQAQHGLDIVAFSAERNPSVYQAKRRQAFGADDLEEAVDRYTEGRRPFGADRLVIAVATEARDTQTIDKLAELREKHKGMEIELWDRREISDRLRSQTNIVSTFFGPATAAAFCTSTPPDLSEHRLTNGRL